MWRIKVKYWGLCSHQFSYYPSNNVGICTVQFCDGFKWYILIIIFKSPARSDGRWDESCGIWSIQIVVIRQSSFGMEAIAGSRLSYNAMQFAFIISGIHCLFHLLHLWAPYCRDDNVIDDHGDWWFRMYWVVMTWVNSFSLGVDEFWVI